MRNLTPVYVLACLFQSPNPVVLFLSLLKSVGQREVEQCSVFFTWVVVVCGGLLYYYFLNTYMFSHLSNICYNFEI